MSRLAPMLWLLACAAPPPAPSPPPPPLAQIAVSAPWSVIESDADHVALRLGDSPHGVRVQLSARDGWVPGVVPVHDGRGLQVEDGRRWPMITVAYPERALERVSIDSEGPDLRVRFEGPPLYLVSRRADAPTDPVLTWVRLRHRGEDWRIVLDGLGVLSLPGPTTAAGWTLTGPAGTVSLQTSAADWSSASTAQRWWLSTGPALRAVDPYPRTSLTLTP